MRRTLGGALIALAVCATALVAPVLSPPGGGTPASTAGAADLRYFDPGNIISDNLFYDGDAMTAGQVQSFLAAKGADCVAGEMPCLKDYRQSTATQAADGLCKGYKGVANETAAAIIAKVGASCNVSQRVLLVLLQKEQGLIRTRKPTSYMYRKATGFACPDTAPCNPQFQGFVSQVYFAARQFQRYKEESWAPYKAFRTNTIQWHPDSSCGTSRVYLENHATAGLYSYTPYRPNQAALDAGYGTGNRCSAYGNRNFWLYYTDWFGSTQSPGGNAIVERANKVGAADVLGDATGQVLCGLAGGGCFQNFEKAAIYWTAGTRAQVVLGSIRSRWAALGWETSSLGYPIRDELCGLADGGCFQNFQHGAIYYSPATGAREILGSIRSKWAAQKWETGPLGYPTTGELCGLADGGCLQQFQGGTIYWTAGTGSHVVLPGDVKSKWGQLKWESGVLGYPTTDYVCGLRDDGCLQKFQGGTVYSAPATGTRAVTGEVLARWGTVGWEGGALGYPTGDTLCGLADDGCFTNFEQGAIYYSPGTGARIVRSGEVRDAWAAQKWETGPLGYPVSDTECDLVDGGCRAEFQGGEVYWTAGTGARTLTGAIRTQWIATGRETGTLGYPTGDQTCGLRADGCAQAFEGGSIYTSAAGGTRAVRADVLAEWGLRDHEDGVLGYPTSILACGLTRDGCVQRFQGGLIYVTPSGGVHTVLGAIRTAWDRAKWETGKLGYPTADETCGLAGGGCVQQFERGRILYGPGTGAWVVLGSIGTAYTRSGSENGVLSYPIRDELCGLVRGGCFQHFRNGSIYYTPTTGARLVTGAIRDHWAAKGWERSSLGYPTAEAVTSGSERTQRFEGGLLVENLTTHAVTVRR